ncbi:MAG TPA: CHAD domain-containing protein [Nevskiaceae bacterium]|nr:CHAD domain-containing protein [Nevskiaceae bacterium]
MASADAQLPRALQRPALAELDDALRHLHHRPTRADVHEARKSCKRLRAWLRLLRDEIGPDAEAARILIRDAGRALSGRRDSEVAMSTLRKLRGSRALPSAQWRSLEGAVRRGMHRHARGAVRGAEHRALDLLRAARRMIERWPSDALTRTEVLRAVRRGYVRARKAWMRCSARSPAAMLHEWRKRTKMHYYQSVLLSRRWKALDGLRAQALDALSEILGDHHDLEVLRGGLGTLPTRQRSSERVRKVLEVMAQRERRLAKRALRAGADVFAQRPRDWLDVIEASPPAPRHQLAIA